MKKKVADFLKKDFSYPEKNRSLEQFADKKKLMNFNRFFSDFKVFTTAYIAGAVLLLILILLIINRLQGMRIDIPTGSVVYDHVSIFYTISEFWKLIILLVVILAVLYFKFAYNVRVSFGSLNVGQKGTASWTTREELAQQYKKVPEIDSSFPGHGGIPIAREGDEIYIDDTAVNNIIVGITRSGKGQTEIEPMIDITSRAEEQASMIITDPKLELSSKMMPELQRRGYECHILNLTDPEFSMGYNPLKLIIDEFKNGSVDNAQQLCRSLAYTIIPDIEGDKDPFWTTQSRNLFVSAIYAQIEDNLEKDRLENRRYKREHFKLENARKEKYYRELYGEDFNTYCLKKRLEQIIQFEPNLSVEAIKEELNERIEMNIFDDIPSSVSEEEIIKAIAFEYKPSFFVPKPFYPSTEHEEKINIYSTIKFCNELSSKTVGKDRTALDEYFNKRNEDNFAKITYGAIISASEQTKGNIMSTFRSKVDVFTSEKIAKMTTTSSIDLAQIGFGESPVAIFIGLPDYDKSNWFIATIFINQMYFISAKLATAMPGGKAYRRISFILDEFGNIPALDNLDNILTVCLGRNIMFTLVIQSFQQIENKYKEAATTIRDNCGNTIYLLAGGQETSEEISEQLGKETITTLNRTGKKLSISKELTEMADEKLLLTPDEVRRLMPGETIVLRTIFRETRTGPREPIQAKPIKNMGEYRMKYSYEYFPEYFPQNRMLYESPSLRRIFEANENLKGMELRLANVRLEKTGHIVLKQRSTSAQEYLRTLAWEKEPFIKNEFPISKVNRIFTLMNLTQDQKDKFIIAGTENEEGDIIMPEHILYNYQIMDYAHQLIGIKDREIMDKGFELMQLMRPLYLQNKMKTREEILAEQQKENDLLKYMNGV